MSKKINRKKHDPAMGGGARIVTNCTDTPRGINLGKLGVISLGPREIKPVTDPEYDALQQLFSSSSFQRFADAGIFRLSRMNDDEESAATPTPDPPASLTTTVDVNGLDTAIGTQTGSKAQDLTVTGSISV